ncbi:hypothetical protein V6N13_004979 [Hibiscus sabdariffa]
MPFRHHMEYNGQEPRNHQPPSTPARSETVEHIRQKELDANLSQPNNWSNSAGTNQRQHHKLQIQHWRGDCPRTIRGMPE